MTKPVIYWTGVGSRNVPKKVAELQIKIAACLNNDPNVNYILRSGHADGSDLNFETGSAYHPEKSEIYLPWSGFNEYHDIRGINYIAVPELDTALIKKSEDFVSWVHPLGDITKMSKGARALHTRNTFQVLGKDLDIPSSFLWCYTDKGEIKGGTATAINIALKCGIPVYNLGNKDIFNWATKYVDESIKKLIR